MFTINDNIIRLEIGKAMGWNPIDEVKLWFLTPSNDKILNTNRRSGKTTAMIYDAITAIVFSEYKEKRVLVFKHVHSQQHAKRYVHEILTSLPDKIHTVYGEFAVCVDKINQNIIFALSSSQLYGLDGQCIHDDGDCVSYYPSRTNNTQSETLSQVALRKGDEYGLLIFKEIVATQFGKDFANRAEQISSDRFSIDGIEFLLTRDYTFNPAPYTLRVKLGEYSYLLANDWFELGLALNNLEVTK